MSRSLRTREPERNQVASRYEASEDVSPTGYRARALWHLLGSLDPSPLLAAAKSVDGRQGRDVLSIRMRLTHRRYAISEGIGSGREIARRLKSAPAFQCIVANTRARTPKPAQDVLPEAGYEGFAARRAGLRRDPGIGREAHGGQPLAHEPRGPGVHPE